MRAGQVTPVGIFRDGDEVIFRRFCRRFAAIHFWRRFPRWWLPGTCNALLKHSSALYQAEAIPFFAVFVEHDAGERIAVDVDND